MKAQLTLGSLNFRSADLSGCGTYRYRLDRYWKLNARVVNFLMLNPSTADAHEDDPTIRRCMAFARSWGYGGIAVTNLFALRATDPGALERSRKHGRDPIGELNNYWIRKTANECRDVVCAWGEHGSYLKRASFVYGGVLTLCGANLLCLRVNRSGEPAHPLYLPASLKPIGYARLTREQLP